jgi:flagellar protein FliS
MQASVFSGDNPYQAYADGAVFSNNPVRLVIALYEGAIEATRKARACLETGDVWGRSKAINKTVAILTELLASLDLSSGGEISQNLRRLYSYMQTRLLEAHARQASPPLQEVETLLGTLLEGWYRVEESTAHEQVGPQSASSGCALVRNAGADELGATYLDNEPMPYAAYFSEAGEAMSGTAFSF